MYSKQDFTEDFDTSGRLLKAKNVDPCILSHVERWNRLYDHLFHLYFLHPS